MIEHSKKKSSETETDNKLVEIKKTFIGRFFPFTKEERFQLFLILLNSFLMACVYSFCKNFKELIIYRDLSQDTKSWMKIIIFLATFQGVKLSNRVFKNSKTHCEGICTMFTISIQIYSIISLLIVFDRFVLKRFTGYWCLVIKGKFLTVRNLLFLTPILQFILNPVMAAQYVIYEVISSIFITIINGIFISSLFPQKSYKRYIPKMILFNNIAPIFVSAFIDPYVKRLEFLKLSKMFYSYIFVNIVVSAVYFVCIIVSYYISQENSKINEEPAVKSTVSTNSKPKFTINEAIKMISGNAFLISLSFVTIGINTLDSFFAAYGGVVYETYADYLTKYPSENPNPDQVPTKSRIAFPYNSKESFVSGFTTVFLVSMPFINELFLTYGPALYGAVCPIISLIGFVIIMSFGSINYPFSNVSKNPMLFGIKISKEKPLFVEECLAVCLINAFLKVGKFLFHGTLRESVISLITPDDRILVKGVVDGIIGKGSKTITAFLLIGLSAIFNKNCVYTLPISFMFFTAIIICWLIANNIVHKRYTTAIKNDTFISVKE